MKTLASFRKKEPIKKNYYFKIVITYSIFILCIVVISSLILIGYFNDTLENEIIETNRSLLEQVKIFSDTYLVKKVNSLIIENFLYIPTQKTGFGLFFSKIEDEKYASLLNTYDTLSSYTLDNRFIESIYLYRKMDDTLVSSKEGININILSSDNKHAGIINTSLINHIMTSNDNKKWVSPLENKAFWKDTPVISYVQQIPMFSDMEERKGCVIINIDCRIFYEELNKIMDSDDRELLIVDSQGRIFGNSNFNEFYQQPLQEQSMSQIVSDNEGFFVKSVDGVQTAVIWKKSMYNDWKYVYIVPIDVMNDKIFIARQFTFIVISLVLVFGLFSLNLISSRLHRQLRNLIFKVKSNYSTIIKDNAHGDIAVIDEVLMNLSGRVDEMKVMLDKNHDLIKHKITLDILFENLQDKEELNKKLRLVDRNFPHDKYCLAVLEIKLDMFNSFAVEQREFLIYKLIETVNEYMSKNYECLSISQPANCIVTVINFDHHMPSVESLDNLLRIIQTRFKLPCNIALSKSHNGIPGMNKLYEDTSNFLKYSFVYGYNKIFTFDRIKKYEAGNTGIDLSVFNTIRELIYSFKTEELKRNISMLEDRIKKGEYSYNYIQSSLVQVTSIIAKAGREKGIVLNTEKNKDISEFKNIDSIGEYVQWIFGIIDRYKKAVEETETHINYEYIDDIKEYIDNNINSEISLESVAEKFNISTSHLSRIFKEGTGVNFSNYVINKKFQKAAKLLTEDKQIKVKEIASQLGYFNMSYFNNMFKKKYGMTPVQYRMKYTKDA